MDGRWRFPSFATPQERRSSTCAGFILKPASAPSTQVREPTVLFAFALAVIQRSELYHIFIFFFFFHLVLTQVSTPPRVAPAPSPSSTATRVACFTEGRGEQRVHVRIAGDSVVGISYELLFLFFQGRPVACPGIAFTFSRV